MLCARFCIAGGRQRRALGFQKNTSGKFQRVRMLTVVVYVMPANSRSHAPDNSHYLLSAPRERQQTACRNAHFVITFNLILTRQNSEACGKRVNRPIGRRDIYLNRSELRSGGAGRNRTLAALRASAKRHPAGEILIPRSGEGPLLCTDHNGAVETS